MFEKDEKVFVNTFLNDKMYVKVKHELYINIMMYVVNYIYYRLYILFV